MHDTQDFIFKKFVKLPKGVSPNERLLFMCILDGQHGGEGCWQSNDYITEWTGIECPKAIGRNIGKLIARGLIRREDKGNTRYLFLTDKGWALPVRRSGNGGVGVAPPAPPTTEPKKPAEPKPAKEKPAAEPAEEVPTDRHDNALLPKLTMAQAKAWKLPDFIPRDAWEAFIEMRWTEPKFRRASHSGRAAKGFVDDIERLKGKGYDPRKLLEIATSKLWQGINDHDSAKGGGKSDPRDFFGLGDVENHIRMSK